MKSELFKRIISSIILLPIFLFIIIKGSTILFISILLISIIAFYEWHNLCRNIFYRIFGYFFLISFFFSFLKLRNNFDFEYIYCLIVLLICVSTDIGGFIFGKIFKGPKLTKISPNKTYSGVVGSFLLSIITILTFYINYPFINNINIPYDIFIFVFLVSTISQLGDLIISYFKRLSKVKDTGNIIPGHGGLLDRIDGMIFAFPFSFIILKFDLLKIL